MLKRWLSEPPTKLEMAAILFGFVLIQAVVIVVMLPNQLEAIGTHNATSILYWCSAHHAGPLD